MQRLKYCRMCGVEFESENPGDTCLNCQTEKGKTRSCIDCGGLIEGSSSRYLCLRCQQRTNQKSEPEVRPAPVKEAPPSLRPSAARKILIIDDEPAMLQLLKIRLNAAGYAVVTAPNGEKGYGMILSEKPDLVISDIMMPSMTGYDLLRKLKKEEGEFRRTPVIIMTSKSQMKDFFSDWEIHAFLIKPFDPQELLAKVEELIVRAKHFEQN